MSDPFAAISAPSSGGVSANKPKQPVNPFADIRPAGASGPPKANPFANITTTTSGAQKLQQVDPFSSIPPSMPPAGPPIRRPSATPMGPPPASPFVAPTVIPTPAMYSAPKQPSGLDALDILGSLKPQPAPVRQLGVGPTLATSLSVSPVTAPQAPFVAPAVLPVAPIAPPAVAPILPQEDPFTVFTTKPAPIAAAVATNPVVMPSVPASTALVKPGAPPVPPPPMDDDGFDFSNALTPANFANMNIGSAAAKPSVPSVTSTAPSFTEFTGVAKLAPAAQAHIDAFKPTTKSSSFGGFDAFEPSKPSQSVVKAKSATAAAVDSLLSGDDDVAVVPFSATGNMGKSKSSGGFDLFESPQQSQDLVPFGELPSQPAPVPEVDDTFGLVPYKGPTPKQPSSKPLRPEEIDAFIPPVPPATNPFAPSSGPAVDNSFFPSQPAANPFATNNSHQSFAFTGEVDDSFPDPFAPDPAFPKAPPPPPPVPPFSPTSSSSSIGSRPSAGGFQSDIVLDKFKKMYNLPADDNDNDDNESDGGYTESELSDKKAAKLAAPRHLGRKKGEDDADMLPSEGEIFSRVSTRSLFSKDWKPAYWVIQDDNLHIYRSKADYEHNPQGSHNYAKKVVAIKHTLRVLKVHPKEYPGLGIMYNFMLEEVFDYGPVSVAKFASHERLKADILHDKLQHLIMEKRKLVKAGTYSY